MQTKQQIQQLLSSAGVSPNHRLGQNFLIDLNLMQLLLDSGGVHSNDIVLEVGCGTGSMTEALAEKASQIIAVELDETLAKLCKQRFADHDNVEILHTDVLENKNTIDKAVIESLQLARQQCSGRVLLVANLPYSVASPVMINLITGTVFAEAMYVTVQKEVAQRMVANAGGKHYGPLSIIMATAGDVKILRYLKPTVFWPQPQVDSAMVSFVRSKKRIAAIHNASLLGETINLFMQHRRKMLKACTKFASNRLAEIHNWDSIFEDCAVDPHSRPEQLTPGNYVAIANMCNEFIAD
ncbi:16S rRNA (adenine(1518)-N(6)/adenine(1519)-N(6))-dimethyltransferase RsmA [Planctomycetota bacterium]